MKEFDRVQDYLASRDNVGKQDVVILNYSSEYDDKRNTYLVTKKGQVLIWDDRRGFHIKPDLRQKAQYEARRLAEEEEARRIAEEEQRVADEAARLAAEEEKEAARIAAEEEKEAAKLAAEEEKAAKKAAQEEAKAAKKAAKEAKKVVEDGEVALVEDADGEIATVDEE